MRKLADLISELRRRRVFRVAVVYAGIAFIIFQIVDATFDYLPIPAWVGTALIVVLLLCFPVAVGMAWAFDLTAEGLVRAKPEREPTAAKAPHHIVIGNKTLAIVAALAIIAAVWSWWGRPGQEADAVAEAGLGERSIAVLPFVNFSDGITDDILTHLSKIGDMEVIARTSSMLYKNSDKRAREIGRELGVATLLEGSVRRYGNRVRVTSQLIDVATEKHLWADEYDRDLTDVFAIQSDVASQIAAALKATLTPEEEQRIEDRHTENLEAYDFYLRGREYGVQQKRQMAAQMCDRAVKLDPTFALAYTGLSSAHTNIYWFHEDHTPKRLAMAKAAVDRALELDTDLPYAHFALGKYYYQGLMDYDRALEQFTIALKGMPNSAPALAHIGYVQRRQGKFEQALANQLKAYELDPRSASLAFYLAETYRLLRRYPEAIRSINQAIALRPDYLGYYTSKAWLYVRREGNTRKAWDVLEEAARNLANAADPRLFRGRARLNMFDRNYSAALEQLAHAPAEVKDDQWGYIPRSVWYAQVYNLMGQGDLARAYYDSARVLMEAKLQEDPRESRYHSTLGIAYAGLGRKEEALRAGQKGVALLPISKNAVGGCSREQDLAIIYTMVGEYEAAIDKLAYLLSIPGDLSVPLLRLDPT